MYLVFASFLSFVGSSLSSQTVLLHLLIFLYVGMHSWWKAVLEDQPSILGCIAPSGPPVVPYLSDQSPEQTGIWLLILLLVVFISGILNCYHVTSLHKKKNGCTEKPDFCLPHHVALTVDTGVVKVPPANWGLRSLGFVSCLKMASFTS